MADYGYLAKIGADTSSFSKAMKSLLSETTKGAGVIKDAFKAIKLDPDNLEAAGTAMQKLIAQQNALREAMEKMNDIKSDVYSSGDTKAIEQYESALLKMQAQLASTTSSMQQLSGSFDLSSVAANADSAIDSLRSKLAELEDERVDIWNSGDEDAFSAINAQIDGVNEQIRILGETYETAFAPASIKSAADELKEVQSLLAKNPDNKVLQAQEFQLAGKAIEETKNRLNEYNAELTQLKAVDSPTEQEAARMRELERDISVYTSELSEFERVREGAFNPTQVMSTKEELAKVQELLSKNPNSTALQAQQMELLRKAAAEAREKLERLNNEQGELKRNSNLSGEALEQAMRQSQREIEACEQEVQDLNRQLNNAVLGVNDFESNTEKSLGAFSGAMAAFAGNMLSTIVNTATSAITSALDAGVKKIYETGTQLETAMSQVAATMLLDKDSTSYANLFEAATEAGKTTVFTADKAAEALNFFALAGYKADEAIAALPNGLAYAQASGQDLGTAVDVLTDSMTALGLKTDDAKKSAENMSMLSDQMAAAASNSNTSVAQLGEAVLTIGATARGLKGGTAELNTMLGVLADNGIKGSEGGTKLRNALNSLISPTKDAQAALDMLNVSLYDSEGKTRYLPEVFLEIAEKTSGFTQEMKDKTLADIFNTRDLAAVNALLSTSADRFDELHSAIVESDGACEKMAETLTDTTAGTKKLLDSAIDGFGNSVFSKFDDDLKELFSELAEYVSEAEESLDGEFGDKLEVLADKLHDLALRMADFALDEGFPALIDGLTWVIDHTDEIKTGAEVVGGIFLAVAGVNGAEKAVDAFKALKGSISSVCTFIDGMRGVSAGAVTAVSDVSTAAAGAASTTSTLSLAISALPWVALASGAVLAASALSGYITASGEAALAASALKDSVDESYLSITSATSALSDMYNNVEQDTAIDGAAEKARKYWAELQTLVDTDGKVIEKQGRVSTIINQLNSELGTHITLVDGQIQGYGELVNSIDGVIEAYKRKAKIDYKKAAFDKAVVEQEGIDEQLEQAEKDYNTAKTTLDIFNKFDEIIQSSPDALSSDVYKSQLDKIRNSEVIKSKDFLTFIAEQTKGRVDTEKAFLKLDGATQYDLYGKYLESDTQKKYNAVGAAKAAKRQNDEIQKDFEEILRSDGTAVGGTGLSENMNHSDIAEENAKKHFSDLGYDVGDTNSDTRYRG